METRLDILSNDFNIFSLYSSLNYLQSPSHTRMHAYGQIDIEIIRYVVNWQSCCLTEQNTLRHFVRLYFLNSNPYAVHPQPFILSGVDKNVLVELWGRCNRLIPSLKPVNLLKPLYREGAWLTIVKSRIHFLVLRCMFKQGTLFQADPVHSAGKMFCTYIQNVQYP